MAIMERRDRRRERSEKGMKALLLKTRSYSHKKRHFGESLGDFSARRKASNRRRREREKGVQANGRT